MKRTYCPSSGLDKEKAEKVRKELSLGFLNLSDGFFEQAKMNFLLALNLDDKCADAYWGLMLEKCQIENEDWLYSSPVKYKAVVMLPEYEKALSLADEDLKNKYLDLLERIYKINEGDNY